MTASVVAAISFDFIPQGGSMYEDPEAPEKINKHRKEKKLRGVETETVKLKVLDSNIFMLNGPRAFFQHGKNNVYVASTVREELNRNKKDKRRVGENVRQTNAFISAALEGKTVTEIKEGIPLSTLSHLVFGKTIRVNVTGLLFVETAECENDPILFGEDFKGGEIVSITIKMKTGIEVVVPVSKDVGHQIKKAFRDMNDRSILIAVNDLKKQGEHVVLVTGDKKMTADAIIKGIETESYKETMEVTQKKSRKRPGRKTSQRTSNWN